MDEEERMAISARLRAPRAGAVAGILFSILFGIGYTLIRLSVPASEADPGIWLAEGSKSVRLGLNLLPFAGICFLWFLGVLRDRMGIHEDRFLATVFLGSGLLFLATVFTSSAATGALVTAYAGVPGRLMDSAPYTFSRSLSYELANVFALRMAGVFMISTCTINIRIGIFPRWMAFVGYLLALCLLVGVGRWDWSPLVFPGWAFLISVYILIANFRHEPTVTAAV
jgi:hypothetical protein